jgi:hypothetical protein
VRNPAFTWEFPKGVPVSEEKFGGPEILVESRISNLVLTGENGGRPLELNPKSRNSFIFQSTGRISFKRIGKFSLVG